MVSGTPLLTDMFNNPAMLATVVAVDHVIIGDRNSEFPTAAGAIRR